MSACLGCVLALGSFGFVSGLGRLVQLVTSFRRDRAIARVLDEAPTAATGTTAVAAAGADRRPAAQRARVAAGILLAGYLGGCGGAAVDPGFEAVASAPGTEPIAAREPAGTVESVALAPPPSFERPRVMVIRADWCGACKRMEPVLRQALSGYEARLDVMILDVTDDDAIMRSARTAEEAGLLEAFTAAGNRTPTVLIARAPDKLVSPNGSLLDKQTFVRAFDAALASSR